MKSVFLLLLLYLSPTYAQYEQLAKPVQISEIQSFTKYQLRQALVQLFKTSSAAVMVAPNKLKFQAPNSCSSGSELVIERSPIEAGPAGQKVRESLILLNCNSRLEVFMLEQHGEHIALTDDNELLRGNVPDSGSTRFYRLYVMNRNIKLDITQGQNEVKMDFQVIDTNSQIQIELNLTESMTNRVLTHQYVLGKVRVKDRVQEEFDGEYIWNLSSSAGVPRQYLYVQRQEVSPADFLKFKVSVYTQGVFPLIQSQFNFNSF